MYIYINININFYIYIYIYIYIYTLKIYNRSCNKGQEWKKQAQRHPESQYSNVLELSDAIELHKELS